VQNLADRSRNLFQAYRIYGLRPANFDGSQGPIAADPGVYFRNNPFDGNVLRNQRTTTYYGGDSGYSSYLLVFDGEGDRWRAEFLCGDGGGVSVGLPLDSVHRSSNGCPSQSSNTIGSPLNRPTLNVVPANPLGTWQLLSRSSGIQMSTT